MCYSHVQNIPWKDFGRQARHEVEYILSASSIESHGCGLNMKPATYKKFFQTFLQTLDVQTPEKAKNWLIFMNWYTEMELV